MTDFRHDERCKGFHNDLLANVGGEPKAEPKSGDKVTVTLDGHTVTHEWYLDQSKEELIHLNERLEPNDNVVAYAFCYIDSPSDQQVMAAVGSNDTVKCWLNGELVHQFCIPMGRWLQKDDDYVPVHLKKGRNRLLMKIGEGSGDFGLVFRLLDYDSTVKKILADVEQHKKLSAVTKEDELEITFGTPHRLEALSPGSPVQFSIMHEKEGKIDEFEGREGFVYCYPVDSIPDGIFSVRASFTIAGHKEIVSEFRHFKGRLPRIGFPGRLTSDLALRSHDGKPYFPIGTYGAGPDDYEYLRSVGYNFVMGGESSLDAAHEAGLGVGLSLHGSGDDWLGHICDTVRKNREHSAVLFWMLFDEPGYNKANLLQMHEAYKLIREEDPVHPVYLVITDPNVYDTFGRCCDLLSVDTYPISQGRIESVGENIEKACRISDGDIPVWHCGQLFDWPGDRVPTIQEHRFMTYNAIQSGAKAMLWFTWRWRGISLKEKAPDLWEGHTKLLQEIKQLEPVLIYPGLGERLGTGHHAIRATAKRGPENSLTIFAVNISKEETVHASIQCPVLYSDKIPVLFEGREIQIKDGLIKDVFKPLDTHVYRIQE